MENQKLTLNARDLKPLVNYSTKQFQSEIVIKSLEYPSQKELKTPHNLNDCLLPRESTQCYPKSHAMF